MNINDLNTRIAPTFERRKEPVEDVREEKVRIVCWGTTNGCDFVYESNGMFSCKIDGKWKILYQCATPDEVTELEIKFKSGEITKEELLSYGD